MRAGVIAAFVASCGGQPPVVEPGVVCETAPDGGPAVGQVVIVRDLGGTVPVASFDAEVADHRLRFDPGSASGSGDLRIDGYHAAKVTWRPEGCDPVELIAYTGTITGTVTGEGSGTVRVYASCGGWTKPEGGAFSLPVDAGPCEVWASRQVGRIETVGEKVAVTVEKGGTVRVDVVAPAEAAGVGLAFEEGGPPWVVREVVPGLGAAAAGVLPGDELEAVDGTPVATTPLADLRDLVLGPDGSTVVFTVRRGGEPVTLAVVRTADRR